MSTDDDRRRIIINSVMASPTTSEDEKAVAASLLDKPSLTWSERRFVLGLVKRILKGA